jgi:uncharacterized protein (DUF58 family)
VHATRRGLAGAFAALALLLASAIFNDFIIEASLLVLLIVILAEAAWVGLATRMIESRITITRDEAAPIGRRTMLYPGDESVLNVNLSKRVGGRIDLESKVNFQSVEPTTIRGTGEFSLKFKFKTPYAGDYSSHELGVVMTGPLGLFSSEGKAPFEQEYVVYPRVLQVAASTVRLLGKAEMGETPIEMPGVGSEYYEMRAYQAGDDFRKVNWKASARQGELIVVEHMKEVGSSFLLVLDARAPGFSDADRLASTFLSIANSLASSGVNFGVLVHDGSKVTAVSSEQDPRASLALALNAAVSVAKLDSTPEFLELMPTRLSQKLAALQTGVEVDSSLLQLQEVRREQVRSTLANVDPWATASNYIRDRSTRSVAYVSGLFTGVEPLIELAWEARHYRDTDFVVVDPCLPRAAEGSDASASETRERHHRLVSALGKAGIPCYTGEPLDLVRRLFAS